VRASRTREPQFRGGTPPEPRTRKPLVARHVLSAPSRAAFLLLSARPGGLRSCAVLGRVGPSRVSGDHNGNLDRDICERQLRERDRGAARRAVGEQGRCSAGLGKIVQLAPILRGCLRGDAVGGRGCCGIRGGDWGDRPDRPGVARVVAGINNTIGHNVSSGSVDSYFDLKKS
jgi:hypothetical protein